MTLNGAPVNATVSTEPGRARLHLRCRIQNGQGADGTFGQQLFQRSKGTLKGDLFAQAQIRGAGITGTNLHKNLAGNLSFNLTNMNYEIVGAKIKRVLQPISLALRVPELMQTPINWVCEDRDGQGPD